MRTTQGARGLLEAWSAWWSVGSERNVLEVEGEGASRPGEVKLAGRVKLADLSRLSRLRRWRCCGAAAAGSTIRSTSVKRAHTRPASLPGPSPATCGMSGSWRDSGTVRSEDRVTRMIVFPYNVALNAPHSSVAICGSRAGRNSVPCADRSLCRVPCAAYESSPDPWYEPFYKHPKLTILYTSITIHKERSISNDLFHLARAG